jgi:hypothetical protein
LALSEEAAVMLVVMFAVFLRLFSVMLFGVAMVLSVGLPFGLAAGACGFFHLEDFFKLAPVEPDPFAIGADVDFNTKLFNRTHLFGAYRAVHVGSSLVKTWEKQTLNGRQTIL